MNDISISPDYSMRFLRNISWEGNSFGCRKTSHADSTYGRLLPLKH